ncbi:Dihydrolipoyllysine-residue acetyltransferase component of acetoin cleaving system [compost metagenome]
MFDVLFHRWLRIPYTLHVQVHRKNKIASETVLFIHGIGNSALAWTDVIDRLPDTVNVIAIDLMGFGESPCPDWAIYDAKTQARSVIATLLRYRVRTKLTIVGHSLGSLVAVEVAKSYPLLVKNLILCSPPFYKVGGTEASRISRDKLLNDLYGLIHRHPEQFVAIAGLAMKLGMLNKAFNVTENNVASYMAALEACIINQTALDDAKTVKKPMTIIHGSLDPVVILGNIKSLIRANKSAHLVSVIAGHEVKGRYVSTVVREVLKAIDSVEYKAKE